MKTAIKQAMEKARLRTLKPEDAPALFDGRQIKAHQERRDAPERFASRKPPKAIQSEQKATELLRRLDVIENLSSWRCSLEEIAKFCGVHLNTVRNYMRDYPGFVEARNRGEAKTDLMVRKKLVDACREGNMDAIKFYLKNFCGMSDKHEIKATGDAQVSIEVVYKAFQKLPEEDLLKMIEAGTVAGNVIDTTAEPSDGAIN